MNLLEQLKKVPEKNHNLNVYYFSPKEVFKITEVSSEIFRFYEQNKDNIYQAIFFKFTSENIFKKNNKPLTVIELIEILEKTITSITQENKCFYISSVDLIYDLEGNISLNTDEEPCYIIS